MAITTTERSQIIQLAVSMFGAVPGGYLTELVDMYEANGNSMTALANALTEIDAYKVNFPSYLSNEEIANKVVEQYGMTNGQGVGTEAYNYVLDALNGGTSLGELYVEANNFLFNTTDATWATPHNLLVNQVKISEYYTVTMGGTEKNLDVLKSGLAGVTASSDFSTTAKMDAFINTVAAGMTNNMLTTGQDIMSGGTSNDLFNAMLIDNANSFQSGDIINGGTGTDSLKMELGNSHAFAIAGKTQSVEKVFVQKQTFTTLEDASNGTDSNNGYATNDGDFSDIDAQDMSTVQEWWSVDSRGDLQIEDVRSSSAATTIGLRNTDAGDVDYEVYFDHATKLDATTAGAELFLELIDIQATYESTVTTNGLLTDNPYAAIRFKMGDTIVQLGTDTSAAFTSYEDMVTKLNDYIASQGLNLVASLSATTFPVSHSETGTIVNGTYVVITNNGPEALAPLTAEEGVSWVIPVGAAPADSNIHSSIGNAPATTTETLTSVNIVLDNAGRDSQTGDLIVGLITDNNTDGGAQQGGEGIQQFDVEVDRNSWISNLASTENVLEVVNVVNIAENNTAGNGNVRIDDLSDVRVFNAAAMVGSVNVTAVLTDAVVAKYMNLVDVAANPAADNITFSYMTGANNDTLDLTIDNTNLAAAGTTTREDFVLNIATGEGNDTVTTMIEDGTGTDAAAWYVNSKLNANLNIETGAGNDTVNNMGAGDFVITTGAGDDTVYVDNTGIQTATIAADAAATTRGVWVLNTVAQTLAAGNIENVLADLVSSTNASHQLYKAAMTVTFKGIASTVTVASTNYMTSDLQINQAIKDAINNDATLNKLLVAQDGPANTLVITSLIDGAMVDGDLAIGLTTTGVSYTATEVTAINTAWGTVYADGAAAIVAMNLTADALVGTDADAYMPVFAEDDTTVATLTGADSLATNDSTITAAAGDDVIVLATGATSNNTVIYDAAFGNDTIVNFNDATAVDAGDDVLDFTAFLGTALTTLGAAASQTDSEVVIVAEVAATNDTAAAVKALYAALADDAVANKAVYIAYDADNIGSVYAVSDAGTAAIGATDVTVTLMGTIDLADTTWANVTVANLA